LTATETANAGCKREITVEIPADVVARETESVLRKYQRLARIPGFRKGKVPASILRQRFAGDIRGEVIESLVPRFFLEEAERQGLKPVSEPRVSDVHLHEGEPLRFRAAFEILPEIELSDYNVRAAHSDIFVSDEEVESALNALREEHASFAAVEDRELRDGDFAQVSFRGVPKDGEGAPAAVDDILVEIGGRNTVQQFSENLLGARPGEERVFDVSYPEDFSDRRLASKTLTYTAQVKAIKRKELPELNDDFARELGEFQSLDALRQRIRESLERDKRRTAEREAKEQIVDELLRRHDFAVPESLIDRQIDQRLERGLRALAAQGMRSEDMKRMDLGRLRAGQREAAEREVKASLLLDKIAEAEKIEVTDEELEKEIEAVASQSKQTVESVRVRLTRNGALDRIRNRIRSEKTLDFLYRKSA
jgi:trigger factor